MHNSKIIFFISNVFYLYVSGEPSENYWKVLAETRRKALEQALVENEELHEKVDKLEDELKKYKELMDEAQDIIDTLNVSSKVISEDLEQALSCNVLIKKESDGLNVEH